MKRPFRLVAEILDNDTFKAEMMAIWQEQKEGVYMFRIWERLKQLRNKTHLINKEYCGLMQELQLDLDRVQSSLRQNLFDEDLIRKEKKHSNGF